MLLILLDSNRSGIKPGALQLRLTDINGDGKADVFWASPANGKWWVSYGGNTAWQQINLAGVPFDQLSVGGGQPSRVRVVSVPTLAGQAIVGSSLTATSGSWSPGGTTLAYQWLASGNAVPRATGTTYTPAVVDIGKPISVRVTASKPGHTSAVASSLPTAPVSAQATPTPTPNPNPTLNPKPNPTAPSKMKAPRVEVRGKKVTVRWQGPTANGSPINIYLIDISKGRDKNAGPSARKVVLKRLKPGRYQIRIAARNGVGWSAYSTSVKFRIR